VALLTLADKKEVLSTLSPDNGKIFTALHGLQPRGKLDLVTGLNIAQLVLKHRESKNHRQRIVTFVGSPVEVQMKELEKLAKKLKKNNVSVDIISFGEHETNQEKLQFFIETVNKDNTSHLVVVPPGTGPLSDSLISSPILSDSDSNMNTAGLNEFGVDANMEPELAMALRLSLEEHRASIRRQEEQNPASGVGTTTAAASTTTSAGGAAPMDTSVDSELQAAIAASTGRDQPSKHAATTAGQTASKQPLDLSQIASLSEEEQLQLALQISMGSGGGEEAQTTTAPAPMDTTTEGSGSASSIAAATASATAAATALPQESFTDPNFLLSLLGTLPGVDPNDPEIVAMLSTMQQQQQPQNQPPANKDKEDEKKDKK